MSDKGFNALLIIAALIGGLYLFLTYGPFHWTAIEARESERSHTSESFSALSLLERRAEHGDPKAMVELGWMYWSGTFVPADEGRAEHMWRAAAERQDVLADCLLRMQFPKSITSDSALRSGLDAMRQRATAGNSIDQVCLGRTLMNELEGTPKDDEAAVKWFRMAADQGDALGQNALGYMYRFGLGVTQDLSQAVEWYRLAASQGLASAQQNLGNSYLYGTGVAENHREAFKWLHLAAEQGHITANSVLGNMYLEGMGVAQDLREGLRRLRFAAELGDALARLDLAFAYAEGIGVTVNSRDAFRLSRLAAEQGLSEAQFTLATMYEDGFGVAENQNEATRWYRFAAEQGHPDAQNELGYRYSQGLGGLRHDDREAVKWFRLAAEQGNEIAQYNLALNYDLGRGVVADDIASTKWYRLAAAQGNADAQSKLAQRELEHCDLRDLLGRKLEWLPTADKTAEAAQDIDLCIIGNDLISRHRLLAEESANSLCEPIDRASSHDIARLRRIVQTPTSDPNQLRQSRSIEMCFPENREQMIKIGLRDFTPVIYSVGTVTINGTMCPAYLYVLESDSGPMRGTKSFVPAFRNACEGRDEELVSRGFQLPSNPSGPPLGDLLEQVGYTGAIPRTHSYKGKEYSFLTRR